MRATSISIIPFLAFALALNVQAQDTLEEVIVTAAKRQQTLQEIPIAVSVVSAESIEQSQVLDIKDLQTLVPSLRVTQLQGSAQTNFIIRGFGNGANNPGIEPSVGVFVDGVYRSRVGSALADLPKVERIEVLRGPQSTLFGKNASAGVISVVTAKPDMDGFIGSIGGTVGNYNQTIIRGDVTGPLSDTVGFSLFASANERDGYFDNLTTGNAFNELNRWNFRGQLLWAPSDKAEIRLIVDAEEIDEVCCGVGNLVDGPTGNLIRALGGDLIGNDPFAYENYQDFDPANVIETQGTSLHIDYAFSNFSVTSITAFRTLDQFQSGDVDFTSAKLVSPNAADTRDTQIDTFTQELRLTSTGDGPLQWMVGAFYFNEEVTNDETFGLGRAFRPYVDGLLAAAGSPVDLAFVEGALGLPVGTFYAEGTGNLLENYALDDETLSLFAQFDVDLTDALTLTVGANYTTSEKEASADVINNNLFGTLPLAAIGLGGLEAAQFLPPFVSYPNSVEDGKSDDSKSTYSVRLAYDLSPNVSVYGGVSTGFKATSWNLSQDTGPIAADLAALLAAGDQALPALPALGLPPGVSNYPGASDPATRIAGPEESTVYEVGLKGEWDTFAINLAVFDQEIEGFQSNIFSGTGFNLANAGKQSTEGLELDATWIPVEGLRIGFAGTWLDPLYDDFQDALGPNGLTDLSGQQPAGIPEFSANTNVTYKFAIGDIYSYVRVEHVYEEDVQVVDNLPSSVASREINMFNASAGFKLSNGLDFNLWGRNLNNDKYLLSAFPSVAQAGSLSGYPNQPRTYGLTVKYNFE
ncbi:MAG TPA: TonB-dependent receptor [Halieaceae bacterium]|nr:TonB-dependent receptor [Halieaceae bacterium]